MSVIIPDCFNCKHRIKDSLCCRFYPNGIPTNILFSEEPLRCSDNFDYEKEEVILAPRGEGKIL